MGRIRRHLTYANVVTTLLLFLVLGGGGAYALSGSNTVFSDDIVNNQVYSADVRDDNHSSGGLQAVDLRPNSVGGSEVQNGSLPPADSKNVVARARGSSSVSMDGGLVPYPLSNNTWTQAANETDFFAGQVTFNAPGCSEVVMAVRIYVDGKNVARSGWIEGGSPVTPSSNVGVLNFTASSGFRAPGLMFEPGSPDARTLTAEIQASCGGGTVTATSLKVNVIGFR